MNLLWRQTAILSFLLLLSLHLPICFMLLFLLDTASPKMLISRGHRVTTPSSSKTISHWTTKINIDSYLIHIQFIFLVHFSSKNQHYFTFSKSVEWHTHFILYYTQLYEWKTHQKTELLVSTTKLCLILTEKLLVITRKWKINHFLFYASRLRTEKIK
jgi:hypothetical protein